MKGNAMSNHKRRHYVVDMDFQARFIMKFVFAMMVGMTVSILLFNHLAMNALETLKWRMIIFERSLADVILPYMFYITVFAAVFTASLLAVVSKFINRDMVSLIYRLRNDLREVAKGNLGVRLGMRETDPFRDTTDELDRMIASMREDMETTVEVFRDTQKIIDTLTEVREEFLPEKCARLVASAGTLEELMKK
jgi:methyl-accepting chemotaxis protein